MKWLRRIKQVIQPPPKRSWKYSLVSSNVSFSETVSKNIPGPPSTLTDFHHHQWSYISYACYQWFRDSLDNAEVNIKFPENHQQTVVVIGIIRALSSSRILPLRNSYKSYRRLTTMLYWSIISHILHNYPNRRADAESHNHNFHIVIKPCLYVQHTLLRHTCKSRSSQHIPHSWCSTRARQAA